MVLAPVKFERVVDRKKLAFLENRNRRELSMLYCLIGSAIGDGLGSPFENKRMGTIADLWERGNTFLKKLAPLGLIYTDDTQMSLSLLESYVVNNTIDVDYVKSLWVAMAQFDWFRFSGAPLDRFQYGAFRGTGKNFRDSVDELIQNGIQHDCSKDTAGNGAAMRSHIIAIAALRGNIPDDERITRLMAETLQAGTITHSNILALSSAFSYAYLLYLWLSDPQNRSLSPHELLYKVAERTKEFETFAQNQLNSSASDHRYSVILKKLSATMKEDGAKHPMKLMDRLRQQILTGAKQLTTKQLLGVNDGFCITSVTSAIVTAIVFRNEPLLGVLKYVIDAGGDTDTVATMVGALLGSQCDGSQMPYYVIQQVTEFESLYQMFDKFVAFVNSETCDPEFTGQFLDQERKVTETILKANNRDRKPHYESKNPFSVPDMLTKELTKHLNQNACSTPDQIREVARKFLVEEKYEYTSRLSVEQLRSILQRNK